jgi:flagella basal body P-ring formation protein FlgA
MLGRWAIASMLIIVLPHAAIGQDVVHVSVKGVVQSSMGILRLADIAHISGGDLIMRRKIAELDILELDDAQASRTLSKQQIEVRILLAGIAARQFHVSGPETVIVRPDAGGSAEQRVLDFLRPGIARGLGVDEDDLQLSLARPLPANADQLFSENSRLEHFLRPTLRSGQLNVKLAAYEGDRLVRTTSVSVAAEVAHHVFVANRDLESGTVISVDDVVKKRRMLSGQDARYVATDVVGKSTRKRIATGDEVTLHDLTSPRPAKREIVIRSRDVVELIARMKSLQVKVNGAVALQQGAVGDVIRVKNPSSGKVLTAEVIDAGTVEIRL